MDIYIGPRDAILVGSNLDSLFRGPKTPHWPQLFQRLHWVESKPGDIRVHVRRGWCVVYGPFLDSLTPRIAPRC